MASFEAAATAFRALLPHVGARSALLHQKIGRAQGLWRGLRDSMEEAMSHVGGIEDDYRRGLLEAHIRGALREINEQITELVSSR